MSMKIKMLQRKIQALTEVQQAVLYALSQESDLVQLPIQHPQGNPSSLSHSRSYENTHSTGRIQYKTLIPEVRTVTVDISESLPSVAWNKIGLSTAQLELKNKFINSNKSKDATVN